MDDETRPDPEGPDEEAREGGPEEPGAVPSEAGEIPAPPAVDEAVHLRERLAAATAQVAALEDKVRRQAAEFLNETRRIQRQADERARYAIQPVVQDLLGVADALHGAIGGLGDTEHERRVAEGLHLVERALVDVLAQHGVARIDALGKPFDPSLHEAVLEAESEGPPRTVTQVLRPGFTLHGRVVRPAHVIVSKAKPVAEAREPGEDEGEKE
jgi:molecular chaperone GrpE